MIRVTPTRLLEHYFKGKAHAMLEYAETHQENMGRYGRENFNFWVELVDTFDNYTKDLAPEIIEMEKDHYKNKTPFGYSYNIIAPTAEIERINRDLRRLARSIEQTERIQATR
ncbi:hypothetical protein GHU05_05500 [Fructobacillus tropaeoli]|uniref:hypothetical protein n=1 Tax=Fructobacillus tropaeoli TaxID=709323 RepID=UPI001455E442|nr:hypothetical protein [Fructobacillus tropaeoli]NLS38381.1 hypothetical protein [Fructobacillus tropaeoli]